MIAEDIKENLFRIKKELGILLLTIRQRNGLTQQFVADSIDMSCGNVYRIEKKHEATLDEMLKLYAFYYSKNYRTVEDEDLFRKIVKGKFIDY